MPLVTGRAAAQAAWQAAPFLADPTAPPDRGPVPAERVAVDLVTPVLLLAISVGGIALLMTSRQPGLPVQQAAPGRPRRPIGGRRLRP